MYVPSLFILTYKSPPRLFPSSASAFLKFRSSIFQVPHRLFFYFIR